jgi:hypothetical protein
MRELLQQAHMPDSHNEPIAHAKLHWYRIPLDRAVLAELNQRSDAWEFAQTLGHLGIISATGAGQVFLPPELRQATGKRGYV